MDVVSVKLYSTVPVFVAEVVGKVYTISPVDYPVFLIKNAPLISVPGCSPDPLST